MNDLTIFQSEQFGTVRTLDEEGKILFCGTDVAKALGYANSRDALRRHCKGVVKHDIGVQTGMKTDGTPATQKMEMLFITEGDLYRLITHSRLPAAEAFEKYYPRSGRQGSTRQNPSRKNHRNRRRTLNFRRHLNAPITLTKKKE